MDSLKVKLVNDLIDIYIGENTKIDIITEDKSPEERKAFKDGCKYGLISAISSIDEDISCISRVDLADLIKPGNLLLDQNTRSKILVVDVSYKYDNDGIKYPSSCRYFFFKDVYLPSDIEDHVEIPLLNGRKAGVDISTLCNMDINPDNESILKVLSKTTSFKKHIIDVIMTSHKEYNKNMEKLYTSCMGE